jgi:lipopolysaccharide export LptBFGC system permease protein LptF
VTFLLSLLGRLSRWFLRGFALLLGLWTLVALLHLVQKHPLMAGSLSWSLAMLLAASSAVPCALAAWGVAVAGCFADWGRQGELAAAASAGMAPRRWVVPVLLLSLGLVPWTLYCVSEVYPAARAAKHIRTRMALRSPDAALALMLAVPEFELGPVCRLEPRLDGTFTDFAGIELDEQGRVARVWRAPRGAVSMPQGRDVLQLRLDDLVAWSRTGSEIDRLDVGQLQLERPLGALGRRRSAGARALLHEATLSELGDLSVNAATEIERAAASAERAARLALALAPLSIGLAAVALGLWAARWGRWAGSLAGMVLVGIAFFPAHVTATRLAGSMGAPWLLALPGLALVLAAVPMLRRWRLA